MPERQKHVVFKIHDQPSFSCPFQVNMSNIKLSFASSVQFSYLQVNTVNSRRRQWHPTPVLLPGKSHGRRSLVGCSPWGREESKSRTRLSNFTFTFHFHAVEKEMATRSSVLDWRIPGAVEPGRLQSMGLHRVRHDWSNLAAAAAAEICQRSHS